MISVCRLRVISHGSFRRTHMFSGSPEVLALWAETVEVPGLQRLFEGASLGTRSLWAQSIHFRGCQYPFAESLQSVLVVVLTLGGRLLQVVESFLLHVLGPVLLRVAVRACLWESPWR